MPTAQTKATDKWQKKVGIISKSFKLKKELTDEFKEIGRASCRERV